MNQIPKELKHTYKGGCHCQNIRFEVDLNQVINKEKIILCNCSMCDKFGYLHLIVPKDQVHFDNDFSQLTNYEFNTKTAQHYFCKSCGVKSFYQPRSHPDCWSVNARCLDDFSIEELQIQSFDGKHWEQNISTIK